MKVPPERRISCGSVASAPITSPGNSGEDAIAGLVTIVFVISGLRARLACARSVSVKPCHSEIEATPCGWSSIAMSRAMRSTAALHIPKMTP